jgi:deazaflavin-dependent oxidoreductase (nitroreductase family)
MPPHLAGRDDERSPVSPSSKETQESAMSDTANDANNLDRRVVNDRNARTIQEFRDNHGRVGGFFEGAPLLLLHTVGARSGQPRMNPMMYLQDGERYLVFASKAGADSHPDWYYNLKAHPDAQIEVGDERLDVRAEEILGAERDELYRRQAALYPGFAGYQHKTARIIPVVALYRRA